MKWSPALVGLTRAATVTVTSTTPATPTGDEAVNDVVLHAVGVAAVVAPNFTVLLAHVALNPVPVITVLVPPAVPPPVGATPVTVGVAPPALLRPNVMPTT